MLFRKKILLAKIESVYNTDPVPVEGTDAILAKNMEIDPYEGPRVSRETERATLGHEEEYNVSPRVVVRFQVEIAGSGTNDTAPAWGTLVRACGFSQTINAATSVVYNLVSTGFESITIYWIVDGVRHAVTGAMGTVRFEFPREGLPFMQFEFTGWYVRPVAATATTPVVSAFQQPIPVKEGNTTFTVDGETPCTENIVYDVANELSIRDIINCRNVSIVDRAPAGAVTYEAVPPGTKDWWADWFESHTSAGAQTVVEQLVHGTAAGNIITIDAPKSQASTIGIGESDALVVNNVNRRFIPNLAAGDDELVITHT